MFNEFVILAAIALLAFGSTFSFPAIAIALYIFIGDYDVSIGGLSVRLSYLFSVTLIIFNFRSLGKTFRQVSGPAFWTLSMIGFFVLLGGFRAETDYGIEKAFAFLIHIVVGYVLVAGVLSNEKSLLQFLFALKIGSVVLAVVSVILLLQSGYDFNEINGIHVKGGDEISLARLLGLGFLVSFFIILFFERNPVDFVVLLACFIPVFLTGNRQVPLVLSLIVFTTLGFRTLNSNTSALRSLFVVILIGFISVYIFSAFQESNAIGSYTRLINNFDYTNELRYILYSISIENIVSNPVMGIGSGNFERLQSITNYPHDIFLELWLEYGFLAIVAYVYFLFLIVKKYWENKRVFKGDARATAYNTLVFSLYAYMFLLSLFSYDLPSNRAQWYMASIVFSMQYIFTKKKGQRFDSREHLRHKKRAHSRSTNMSKKHR